MLKPIINQLGTKRIVLASKSPRRQELIQNIGLRNVELIPSLFPEDLKVSDFPNYSDFVEETALQKVLDVSKRLSSESNYSPKDLIIIGGDTVVTLGGKMYGQPKTPEKSMEVLKELMGKSHVVYTGIVIKYDDQIVKFTETANVKFGNATTEQIQAYVDTGEPLDKAGGYGIQGVGGTFIERIEGDFFTVMGLPLYRLSVELCKLFNYDINSSN